MEFFRIKKDIPFMRHALVFNAISALTFVAAVFFLIHNGLHFSIEFTGGSEVQLQYTKAANLEGIRGTLETLGYEQPEVTGFGTATTCWCACPSSRPSPATRPRRWCSRRCARSSRAV